MSLELDGDTSSKLPLKKMFLRIKESLACQTLSKKRSEHNRSCMNCYSPMELLALTKNCVKLRSIKNTPQSLSNDWYEPSQHESQASQSVKESDEYQWSYGAADTSKIYGWDDDVETINKELLKEDNKGLNLVGIVGNFGTGKTALAQKIFMSDSVMDAFALRLWVCVSPKCKREELVWRMLDNLGLEDVESILDMKGSRDELGVLLFLLHLQLLDKRYLIVFDDIWEFENNWHANLILEPPEDKEWTDCLAYGLPNGNGNAIIVTSRLQEVATKMVGRQNIHRPKPLGDDNGWLLFKSAFEEVEGGRNIKILEGMKHEITRKCDGLPLALKTAGRELAIKSKDEEIIVNTNAPKDDDTTKTKEDNTTSDTEKKDDDSTTKTKVDDTSEPKDDETTKTKVDDINETKVDDETTKTKVDDTSEKKEDDTNEPKEDNNDTNKPKDDDTSKQPKDNDNDDDNNNNKPKVDEIQ